MKNIILGFLIVTILVGSSSYSFNDIGKGVHEFNTIKIGKQVWMSENLNIAHFRNGDLIFEANSFQEWEYANIKGIPAWCYYNNNPSYGNKYGKLYNYWAVSDPRGLAPEGWRIPNENELLELAESLGGIDIAGNKMKSTEGWNNSGNGDNASGFTGLPGGYRSHYGPRYTGGPFYEAGESGYWWTTTRYLVDNSWAYSLLYEDKSLGKRSFVRTAGLSVRLVKD